MFIGISLWSRPRQFPQKSHLSWAVAVVTLQIVSQGELWLIGDEEEEGSDKSVTELLLIRLFEPFVLQKVKSRGGAGAEVQTKPPSPPLDTELAVVISPQLSNLRGIEKWSILGSFCKILTHCKM